MGMSIYKLCSGYTSVPESGSLSLSSVAPLPVTGTMPAWKHNHGNKTIMKFMSNCSLTNNNIVHVLMRDEKEGRKKEARRKQERSKQGQTNNKATQHSTPKAVTFPTCTCTSIIALIPCRQYNMLQL